MFFLHLICNQKLFTILQLIFYFAIQLKILFSDHNHITSTFYLIRTYKDLVSYEQCLLVSFPDSLASMGRKKVLRQFQIFRKIYFSNCIWQQQKETEKFCLYVCVENFVYVCVNVCCNVNQLGSQLLFLSETFETIVFRQQSSRDKWSPGGLSSKPGGRKNFFR